jgi:2,4-diketo-3-deoxy-L-fuconate hydrolase
VKIASFVHPSGGRPRIGVVDAGFVTSSPQFATLDEVYAAGDAALEDLRAADGPRISMESVTLLPPVPAQPRNIYCVGWNYEAHVAEGEGRRLGGAGEPNPEHPTFFSKAALSVTAPHGPILLHGVTEELDWEAELAVVIGRRGRDIDEANADQYVFGYTIANDVTARDVQHGRGGQWFQGKSLDGTCPIGPWIVTVDELPDVEDLVVSCAVNGMLKQRAQVGGMHFKVPRIIAELSAGLTLLPGDVILTGTPEGTGNGARPPVFLQDGDVLETSISRIGTLRNVVVPAIAEVV